MFYNFLLVNRSNIASSVEMLPTGLEEVTAYVRLIRVNRETAEL
jgi:hypothetical protein